MVPVSESSLGICSSEKDVGVILAASLMNKSALDPLNDQQLPGWIEF